MTALLPAGFEALEPFAQHWAGETAAVRADLRGRRDEADRLAFHAACAPLLKPGLDYLDARPLSDLDISEQRLMRLLLSFAHVTLAVEVQGDDEAKHRPLRETMRISCAPADM